MNIIKKSLHLFLEAQLIAFVGLVVLTVPAHAESASSLSLTPDKLTPDQMKGFQKLQLKMYAIGQQLDEIRQKTLEAKPKLKSQQDEYQSLLIKTMKKQGNDPDPALVRMHQIRGELQNQGLTKDKRKQLITEYQQKEVQIQQAGHDAIQDKRVHKAAEELSKATVVAMREQEPKTAELLQEMEQLRQQMQQLIAKAKADASGK
jgi:hypothetical protein